jgi:NAD(P)-dependent dehydrogenase (short-subunit alcohol dehydrogenase family)
MLFVNAGIGTRDMIADICTDEFIRMMVTNALSPMRVVESLRDLVLPTGTIGIMSSGQGSITNNENGHYEIYRGSKTALNMFNLANTMDAQAGKAGLQYLDYLGRKVPW